MDAGAGFFESGLSADQIGWLGRYDTFDYLVGRLTQSAIDAFMVGKGWTMVGPSQSATGYRRSTAHARGKGVNATTFETCTRPGPDGWGGGRVTTVTTLNGAEQDREESTVSFDSVRDDIKGVVARFADCPDPSSSADIAIIYDALACHLVAGDGGSLTAALRLIETASEVLTGNTAETYKRNFLLSIGKVLDNYSAFGKLIGHLMATQSGMWAAVRANTVGMLIKSRMKFDDVAQRGPTGYNYAGMVKVIDIALGVAGIFAPKPVDKGIKLVVLAFDQVSGGEPGTVGSAATYDQVLDRVLMAGLGSIAKQVKDLEAKIKNNAVTNLEKIAYNDDVVRSLFELPNPGSLDLSDEPDIATDLDAVTRIRGHMKSIVEEIGGYVRAGRDVNDGMTRAVVRSTDLGDWHFGPGPLMQELGDMFCDILTRLKNQVDLSADNLYNACMVLLSKDEEYAAQVAASAAGLEALDSPNGYADPWRYSKDPEPSPADRALVIPDMWRMWVPAPTSPILSAPPDAQHTDFQAVVPEFEKK